MRSLLRTRRRLVESSVQGAEQFAAFLDAGMGQVDPTLEEVEYRLLCEMASREGDGWSSAVLQLRRLPRRRRSSGSTPSPLTGFLG